MTDPERQRALVVVRAVGLVPALPSSDATDEGDGRVEDEQRERHADDLERDGVMVGQQRDAAEEEPDGGRADVPHEDGGRREVQEQEAQARAGQGHRQRRRRRSPADPRGGRDGHAADDRLPAGEPVDAVHEVVEVREPDHPEHGERRQDPRRQDRPEQRPRRLRERGKPERHHRAGRRELDPEPPASRERAKVVDEPEQRDGAGGGERDDRAARHEPGRHQEGAHDQEGADDTHAAEARLRDSVRAAVVGLVEERVPDRDDTAGVRHAERDGAGRGEQGDARELRHDRSNSAAMDSPTHTFTHINRDPPTTSTIFNIRKVFERADARGAALPV